MGFSGVTPNDKIQLGFIGVGRQGRGLMTNFVNYDNAAVVAVSDIDIKKMAYFTETFQKQLLRKKNVLKQLSQQEKLSLKQQLQKKILLLQN